MKESKDSLAEVSSVLAGVLLAAAFLLMAPFVFAQQPLVNIAPHNATSEGCVALTSATWTQAPAVTLVGRLGFWWTNPSTWTLRGTTDNTVPVSSSGYVLAGNAMIFIGLSDAKTFYQNANSAGTPLLGCAAQERN